MRSGELGSKIAVVSYRDEQQALLIEVAVLERDKQRLQLELLESQARFAELLRTQYEERRKNVRMTCVMCSGNLLPVAIVAGHDVRNPLPLKMSTLRFGSPEGGFTASAPVRSYACGTCGYIHSFIDMDRVDAGP
jgi:hypothetical protein